MWETMKKTSSDEVSLETFEKAFYSPFVDSNGNGTVSWTEAGNYIHAMLEIGNEAGMFDGMAVARWGLVIF